MSDLATTLRQMSCYNRAKFVRSYHKTNPGHPEWSPVKVQVTTCNGTPAELMADANGDLSLWSRTADYRGSLSLGLLP